VKDQLLSRSIGRSLNTRCGGRSCWIQKFHILAKSANYPKMTAGEKLKRKTGNFDVLFRPFGQASRGGQTLAY
jgi:hypothetical protein